MDAWRRDARWGSGAAVALVAAASGLLAHLSLRADSVGSGVGRPALVIGGVLLTLVLWPLAARTTGVGTLAAVLLVAQFGTHALALVAAGATVRDPRSLICCPPTEATRSGLLGQLTAQAGWTLVAVQVLACVLLAAAIRGSRDGADLVAFAFALTAAVLSSAAVLAGRVLVWLHVRTAAAPAEVPAVPSAGPVRLLDPGAVLARRSSRRGPPPRCALVQAGAASRPVSLLAAG